jgi:hypothetical protein
MESGICVETLPEDETEVEEVTDENIDTSDEESATEEPDDLSWDDDILNEETEVERLNEDDNDVFSDNSQARNELLTGESACGCAITGTNNRAADLMGLFLLIGLFSCLRKRRSQE